jgi:hydrogenase maturation protease
MNQALVDQIANAVLYEGFLLYPYRPSVKNRQRWTFGGIYPPSYSRASEGTDRCLAQTECLVLAGETASLRLRVRFLQLQVRRVEGASPDPFAMGPAVWQEAVEREIALDGFALAALIARSETRTFAFPSRREEETRLGPGGENLGAVIREQRSINGGVEISAERAAGGIYKVTVQVRNETPFEPTEPSDRDEALMHSFVSTHTILGVREGEFVSLLDPPESCGALVAACRNVGTWPVLVGKPGEKDTMLSAPIILYDYPAIAPESPGDLFDATEIDEILTLRILTLTEDEKRAMAGVDPRARALLERTESMAREQLMGLHGTVRNLRPL